MAQLAIHELPSARACTYVVPASDFALALRVAMEFSGGELALARKLGVNDEEIARLCAMRFLTSSAKGSFHQTKFATLPATPRATSAQRVQKKA